MGPNCTGIAASNPGLAKYITGAIGFPFALLQVSTNYRGRITSFTNDPCFTFGNTMETSILVPSLPSNPCERGCRWNLLPRHMVLHAPPPPRPPVLTCRCTSPSPRPALFLQILVCGSELFTGNTALATAAVYEGKANLKGLAKNWVCSYAGAPLTPSPHDLHAHA